LETEADPVFAEDDDNLWSKFKQGDGDAFTSLYNKYITKLYNYGLRICPDNSLIEDSLHDLFVELWKNRAGIGQTTSVKAYLYRGLKNRLIKNIQKERKLSHTACDDTFEIAFSIESAVIAEETSAEQRRNLLKAINDLSPRQKEALTLRFFDELSYHEIASVMVLPVKSVYMLIYRAIGWLKENMKLTAFLFFLSLLS
jgi:RNA polymerase sigma factor (sigma-70 family)